MSHRQIKKILDKKNKTKNSDTDSDQSEDSEKPRNFFKNLESGDISSSSEDEDTETQVEKTPEKITKILSQTKTKEKEKASDITSNLDTLLQEFDNLPSEPQPDLSRKDPVLKRHLSLFDPSKELQKLFKEEKKTKKADHSGKKLGLTPNMPRQLHIDYLLAMEKVPDPSKSLFYFDISKNYSKIHPNYVECIESNDPNSLNQFLHRYPFHVEALYQMCMVFQMQGNYEQVSLLVERLLYSLQLSFHYQFSIIGSDIEIDMNQNVYNKIFYRALMIHTDCLGRKGCVRTALEVCKLMLALSPRQDPLGAIFLIDYYCVRAKTFTYFEHFAREFMKEVYGYGTALVFPNILYGLALVKAVKSGSFEISAQDVEDAQGVKEFEDCFLCSGSAVLLCAVSWHPELARGVLKKLGAAEFKDEELGKIAEIYGNRTEDLWKPHVVWLKKTVGLGVAVSPPQNQFEGILDRYNSLDKHDFSFEVRTIIPQEMEIGRPRTRGNLSRDSHPLYLFFASLLPWNYLD